MHFGYVDLIWWIFVEIQWNLFNKAPGLGLTWWTAQAEMKRELKAQTGENELVSSISWLSLCWEETALRIRLYFRLTDTFWNAELIQVRLCSTWYHNASCIWKKIDFEKLTDVIIRQERKAETWYFMLKHVEYSYFDKNTILVFLIPWENWNWGFLFSLNLESTYKICSYFCCN